MTLRAMTPADLEAVAALARRADPYSWTIGQLREALAHGNRCTVACSEDTIVGYSITMQVIDEAELLEIAVDPAHQGQGWGRALLQEALEAARHQGARCMHLEVRESNAKARKMYASVGFRAVGARPNYYPCPSGREDAVLMTLEFEPHPQ